MNKPMKTTTTVTIDSAMPCGCTTLTPNPDVLNGWNCKHAGYTWFPHALSEQDWREAQVTTPYTEGSWLVEKQSDGSTWVIGTDPQSGREALIAAFEIEEDARYVANLHNRNLNSHT